MDVKKILWPTDLSQSCNLFMDSVCQLAKLHGAALELLYIAQDPANPPAWYGELEPERARKFHDQEIAYARKRLNEACTDALSDCPLAMNKVVAGDAATEVLKAVEEDDIDLMVMIRPGGEAGKSPSGLAGAAETIIRQSPVPVLSFNSAADLESFQ